MLIACDIFASWRQLVTIQGRLSLLQCTPLCSGVMVTTAALHFLHHAHVKLSALSGFVSDPGASVALRLFGFGLWPVYL
jgi:hypothetical protein